MNILEEVWRRRFGGSLEERSILRKRSNSSTERVPSLSLLVKAEKDWTKIVLGNSFIMQIDTY